MGRSFHPARGFVIEVKTPRRRVRRREPRWFPPPRIKNRPEGATASNEWSNR